jgi:hypothetical protein
MIEKREDRLNDELVHNSKKETVKNVKEEGTE